MAHLQTLPLIYKERFSDDREQFVSQMQLTLPGVLTVTLRQQDLYTHNFPDPSIMHDPNITDISYLERFCMEYFKILLDKFLEQILALNPTELDISNKALVLGLDPNYTIEMTNYEALLRRVLLKHRKVEKTSWHEASNKFKSHPSDLPPSSVRNKNPLLR